MRLLEGFFRAGWAQHRPPRETPTAPRRVAGDAAARVRAADDETGRMSIAATPCGERPARPPERSSPARCARPADQASTGCPRKDPAVNREAISSVTRRAAARRPGGAPSPRGAVRETGLHGRRPAARGERVPRRAGRRPEPGPRARRRPNRSARRSRAPRARPRTARAAARRRRRRRARAPRRRAPRARVEHGRHAGDEPRVVPVDAPLHRSPHIAKKGRRDDGALQQRRRRGARREGRASAAQALTLWTAAAATPTASARTHFSKCESARSSCASPARRRAPAPRRGRRRARAPSPRRRPARAGRCARAPRRTWPARVRREAAAAGQGPRERRRQARSRRTPAAVGREDGVRNI